MFRQPGTAVLAVLASFKSAGDLYDADPLPLHPVFDSYRVALADFPVVRLLADTVAVAAGVMILQLAVATLAAYALVRVSARAGRLALTAGTVAVLVFASTWNEYLWPLIATPGGSPGTIQTGLALFLNTEGASPGPLLAAATLATLPVLAAYAGTARQITNAFMHSGID